LRLGWRHHGESDQYSVSANLKNLNLAAGARPVGFSNLTGELVADQNGGHLTLRQVPLWFELPRAFPGPGQFESLTAVATWQRADDGWRLRVPDFKWRLAGSDGQGTLALQLPREGSPVLDLNAHFTARDATR